MHETALALSLMDLVDEVATAENAKAVREIHVELGALSCVEVEAFKQAVSAAALGRRAAEAVLVIERPPGQARCIACGGDLTLRRRDEGCPNCGSHQLLVTSGDGMRLTAIEVI